MLNRFFSVSDKGRQWGTDEDRMPLSSETLPICQQGILSWGLPEKFRIIKLIWKSKNELAETKRRGVPESGGSTHVFSGKFKICNQNYVGIALIIGLDCPPPKSPHPKT